MVNGGFKMKRFIKELLCKHHYDVIKSECEDDATVRKCSKCKKRWVYRHEWAYLR